MTNDSTFKRKIRDHAAAHGLPYTEARTRLLRAEAGPVATSPLSVDEQSAVLCFIKHGDRTCRRCQQGMRIAIPVLTRSRAAQRKPAPVTA